MLFIFAHCVSYLFMLVPNIVNIQGWIQDLLKGGPWRACRVRAYNRGLGVEPPVESRAEPLLGVRGEALLKLKAFCPIFIQKGPEVKDLNENSPTSLRQTASCNRDQ